MKLNSVERQRVCELYLEGEIMTAIASKFGVSYYCVWSILAKAGIRSRKQKRGRKKILQKVSDEERIVELYEKKGLSGNEIAKIFHVSINPILRILKSKRKLRSPSESNQIYQRDSTFFKKIDHERKAYWLGLLAADGCVYGNTLKLNLEANDRELLELFLADLKSNAPISLVKCERDLKLLNPNGKLTTSIMAGFSIGDKALTSDLKKWGIVERKTFVLKFPQLGDQLLRHFIRGYFDGDGCISEDRRQRNITQACFSIVSANFDFLSEVQRILIQNCKLRKTKLEKNRGIYDLRYSGNRQGFRIYNYLYRDATVFLRRKRDKFRRILKINPNQLSFNF